MDVIRKYPVRRQPLDDRDKCFATKVKVKKLPTSVDLRTGNSKIFDQGSLGSCTANAGVTAYTMTKGTSKELSRLFQYYTTRSLEGTTAEDNGAYMRDIGKAIKNFGICQENTWPYIEDNFAIAPSQDAFLEAPLETISGYTALYTLDRIKEQLSKGKPVLMGLEVYNSFEKTKTNGFVAAPQASEKLLGGHAMTIVGYKDEVKFQYKNFFQLICSLFSKPKSTTSGYFIVQNSWGEDWGDNGFCYISYEILEKYGYDYWVLEV